MTRLMPLLVLVVALVLAPSALAASRNQIIKDCADDGQLEGHYSQSQLRDASQHLPSDVAEYTDCADVLRRAELPDAGSSSSGGGASGPTSGATAASGGSSTQLLTPQSDADRKTLAKAAASGGAPVKVNGESLVPGAAGLRTDAARSSVPAPLLVALILAGLAGGALTIPAVRRHLPFLGR